MTDEQDRAAAEGRRRMWQDIRRTLTIAATARNTGFYTYRDDGRVRTDYDALADALTPFALDTFARGALLALDDVEQALKAQYVESRAEVKKLFPDYVVEWEDLPPDIEHMLAELRKRWL